jgi:hypothetical protein
VCFVLSYNDNMLLGMWCMKIISGELGYVILLANSVTSQKTFKDLLRVHLSSASLIKNTFFFLLPTCILDKMKTSDEGTTSL